MPNSSSYRTIAVASTFSPRFLQVLAEAKRIRDRFGSELRLIYVGPQSEETNSKFAGVLQKLELPADLTIHYEEGDPSESILRALRENSIEMIVAGALEKEVIFHPFLGNVARQLVREATCSVMLFTHPENDPKPFRRMVFVVDKSYSEHARAAFQRTLQLAAAEKSERVYVIQIVTRFDEARASRRTGVPVADKTEPLDEEEAALEKFVLRPARPTCRWRRGAFAGTPVLPRPISCNRLRLTCSRSLFRSRAMGSRRCRGTLHGSPT